MVYADLCSDVDFIASKAAEDPLATAFIELDAECLQRVSIAAAIHSLSNQDDRSNAEDVIAADKVAQEQERENQNFVW